MTTTRERCEDLGGRGANRRSRYGNRAVVRIGLSALTLAVAGWITGIYRSGASSASGVSLGMLLSTTPTVQVESNPTYGNILTTGAGLALYTLNTDHGAQSTCTGACAEAWPALTVPTSTTPTVSRAFVLTAVLNGRRHLVETGCS